MKSGGIGRHVQFGCYFRKSDRIRIKRFLCQVCGKTGSEASRDLCFRQHKRQVNPWVARSLVSGVSLRRCAWIYGLNRKTVVRKFIFLGINAFKYLPVMNSHHPKVSFIEFDDLETIEHTKLKPLSVTLAVSSFEEPQPRRILGFQVSRMPAKGPLSSISIKKYGPRKDNRSIGRARLFRDIKACINEDAVIKSDQNPHYPSDVKKHLPKAVHQTHRGRRGSVTGQGELKKIGYDPLFSLNHTCAMLRANINRLFRKTWCTTKRPDRLELHIALYAVFHNMRLNETMKEAPSPNHGITKLLVQ